MHGPPPPPTPGTPIPRGYWLDLYRWIDGISRDAVRGDGKTVRVNAGTISVVPQPRRPQPAVVRFGIAAIGGLTLSGGEVTADVTTTTGEVIEDATVAISGAPNGTTFDAGLQRLCWENADRDGWVCHVTPWDYMADVADYGSGEQVFGHGSGSGSDFKWFTVAAFECPS